MGMGRWIGSWPPVPEGLGQQTAGHRAQRERYRDTEDLDGLFSGYDPRTASYDPATWSYESVAAEEGNGRRDKEQSAPYQLGSGGPAIEGGASEIAADPAPALLAGSALQRFGTFEAGVVSTKDPKYVVVPQRERLEAKRSASRAAGPAP